MVCVALLLSVGIGSAAVMVGLPPVREQLVEGHTVFALIEVVVNETNAEAQYAAAVAVLVREYDASKQTARFPGVLWFNDQYLVNPTEASDRSRAMRYPCGGAVMAVNKGDPDPRVGLSNATPFSEQHNLVQVDGITTGVETAGQFDYRESYLISDPNDNTWVIDKYQRYTRVGISNTLVYTHPVWVVNILGHPGFLVEDGISNCGPYLDYATAYGQLAQNDPLVQGYLREVEAGAEPTWNEYVGSRLPYRDDPYAGYNEPSRNGYCYNGVPVHRDSTGDGTADSCDPTAPSEPVRLYNALLYFWLRDLNVEGPARSHSDPTDPTDTNGCQVGTEWQCPGDDDDREGNSHPFHPTPGGRNPPNSPHTYAQACPSSIGGPNAANHGGSTQPDFPYCDYDHGTRNIDIYFSPYARPLPPAVRMFNPSELPNTGSSAPFHNHHAAYPDPPSP